MPSKPSPKNFRDLVENHRYLLINPLQWTLQHLDILGCHFEDVGTIPVNLGISREGKSSDEVARVSKALASTLSALIKHRCIVQILVNDTQLFTQPQAGFPFHFKGQPIHRPKYIVFHPRNLNGSIEEDLPPVGYVHYTAVNGDRRRQFEPFPSPRGDINYIGAKICQKRLAKTTPKEWISDPYFLCHLLALAQLQEQKVAPSGQSSYTSRLLVTNVLNREFLLLFEAEVPSMLLEGLRNPQDATNSLEWPRIRRKKLLFKPFETFADRLLSEFVTPSSLSRSCFNGSVNEKYLTRNLRKRHQDEDGGLMKKRRLS